ncbi:MAG: transposase [Terracidiphilus sp.]
MLDETERRRGAPTGAALADSGFFSVKNLEQMERDNIDGYVPDSNLAAALNLGVRCRGRARAAAHRRMRAKLRSPAGQALYARRKSVVEPVFGVLKQQRGMRQFRTPWDRSSQQRIHSGHAGLQHHPAAGHAGSLNRQRNPTPNPALTQAPSEHGKLGKR